jgi:hypothetical protein
LLRLWASSGLCADQKTVNAASHRVGDDTPPLKGNCLVKHENMEARNHSRFHPDGESEQWAPYRKPLLLVDHDDIDWCVVDL